MYSRGGQHIAANKSRENGMCCVIGVMYFPDRSARGDQLTGADSGLDKILAEFQTSPSCNFDEHILPPDSFLQSSGLLRTVLGIPVTFH